MWFLAREQARAEIKRRLGVVRLHEAARRTAASFSPDERTYVHEGFEWQCVFAEEYSTVPASDPDFRRAGGFRLCVVERPAEPFTNPFIRDPAISPPPTPQAGQPGSNATNVSKGHDGALREICHDVLR